MGIENQHALTVDFAPQCLVEVIEEHGLPGNDALPLVSSTGGTGCASGGVFGEHRRILVCARCSLVAWMEHDADFSLTAVQPPEELRKNCRSVEEPWQQLLR